MNPPPLSPNPIPSLTSWPQKPEPNDLDRRIWEDELDAFVPPRVFDAHSHIYRWQFDTSPNKDTGPFAELIGRAYPEASWAALDHCDGVLMPGRRMHRLVFPFPFTPECDFEASNRFAAEEVRQDAVSAALMLVHPAMTEEYVEAEIDRHGFLGLKPYRFYSATADMNECRVTDFLPEHQIAVADRRGLLIMLHLSKRAAIADPENIEDVRRLCEKYPAARWILAHCARSYSSWAIETAAPRLAGLPNLWYETSSVCESDAIEALLAAAGADRVMYGSDDIPVGVSRGKYIAFGRAWAYLSETNHSLDLSHCDPRMTFTRYEQLRAMRRAAVRLGLTGGEIENIFCGTALKLIESARRSAK
ncbi:MAG: amidohydrolase family protein [Planctomycetia bacterium]|nr:amidohydrolase family protein [Planctomycetia bacterium]